jgi:hypothetical protein
LEAWGFCDRNLKKTREAAGGWLRLEDEGIKRDEKVEGLVCSLVG